MTGQPAVEKQRQRCIDSFIKQAQEFDAEAQRQDRAFYPMLRRLAFRRRAHAREMEAGADI